MPRRATRPRFDTLLEDHAELRVKDLNARGIFEANFGEIFVFRVSGKEVRIRYLDEQKVVFVIQALTQVSPARVGDATLNSGKLKTL